MDILTLVGLVAGVLIVVLAMLANASILTFFNLPGLAIVLGGTFAVTLIKFRLPSVMSAFRLAFSAAFKDRVERPAELIREVGTLALVVRKEGILGLENHATKNEFLQKAINLCVDGHPPELVEEALAQETQQTAERYEVSERVFRGIGESAPAIGMLGTLVGLVQMLNTLDDPSSIGPAMAIALLTTLYGAFIAQLIALRLNHLELHFSPECDQLRRDPAGLNERKAGAASSKNQGHNEVSSTLLSASTIPRTCC